MPPSWVKTVEDWIFYQYAKYVLARAIRDKEGKIKSMKELEKKHFGQIVRSFNELKSGKVHMTPLLNDEKKFVELGHECFYCGELNATTEDHIIPRDVIGKMAEPSYNIVWACKSCNSSKGKKEFISWFKSKFGEDTLPRKHVMSKYLKFLHALNFSRLNNPYQDWDVIFRE